MKYNIIFFLTLSLSSRVFGPIQKLIARSLIIIALGKIMKKKKEKKKKRKKSPCLGRKKEGREQGRMLRHCY